MIQVSIRGGGKFKILTDATDALKSLGTLMYDAGAQLLSDKDKNFNDTSYNGEPWKPYAKSTIRWLKENKLWPRKLLHGTSGRLMESWKRDILPGPVLMITTNVKYAALQNFGGTVTIGPHEVSPSHVKGHWVKAHYVKAHTTRKGTKIKRKKIKKYWCPEHDRSGYFNLKGGGERVIPPRPFLPNQKINYIHYLKALSYRFKAAGVPVVIEYDGQEIKPKGAQ